MFLPQPVPPKICSTLSTALFYRFYNTVTEKPCCKKLRIPTNDFFLLVVKLLILEIDVVSEYLKKSYRRVHTLDHSTHFVKRRCGNLVIIIDSAPSVEVFVWRTHCTRPVSTPSLRQANGQ